MLAKFVMVYAANVIILWLKRNSYDVRFWMGYRKFVYR